MASHIELLNEQIGHEYAAHQQYVATAVWYDVQALPALASFFYEQALEERNHAMMIVQYLVDIDAEVAIPGVAAPSVDFDDLVAPVALALEQEKQVSAQFDRLAEVASQERDHKTLFFVQWFLKEQVEEVATMSDLLTVVERGRDQPLLVEEFLARSPFKRSGTADSFQPDIAGPSA
jgi:bacterioferritin B